MGTRVATTCVALLLLLAACGGPAPAGTPVLLAPTGASTAPTPNDTAPPGTPRAVETAAPATGTAPLGPIELATVVRITDGDTIRVDRGFGPEAVRYIGINTPEVGDPGGEGATRANSALVEGLQVVLERDVSDTDQFDRLLRYIWIEESGTWTFVNLELIRSGFAQVATYPPDVRYADLFLLAEQDARSAGAGLWAEPTDPPDDEPGDDCHPSYDPCLPIVGDLDCADVRALGLAPVRVRGSDPYRLDGDNDGAGCE